MRTLYHSDLLNENYATEEDCLAAEKEYQDKLIKDIQEETDKLMDQEEMKEAVRNIDQILDTLTSLVDDYREKYDEEFDPMEAVDEEKEAALEHLKNHCPEAFEDDCDCEEEETTEAKRAILDFLTSATLEELEVAQRAIEYMRDDDIHILL